MPYLALYTFGLLHEDWGHDQIRGFEERIGPIFGCAAETPGLLHATGCGTQTDGLPRLVRSQEADPSARTLTLWRDLESAFAFTYRSIHAEALRQRHAWFKKHDWPSHCAWWVEQDSLPAWTEAVTRYEHLHDHGATAYSFDFRTAFAPDGSPTRIRRVETPAA